MRKARSNSNSRTRPAVYIERELGIGISGWHGKFYPEGLAQRHDAGVEAKLRRRSRILTVHLVMKVSFE
jgi:hypothetical protein